jgi:hypothetical protein
VLAVVMRHHSAHAATRARPFEHKWRDCRYRQLELRCAHDKRRRPGRATGPPSCGASAQGLGASTGPNRHCFVGLGVGGSRRGRVVVHLALVFGPGLVTGSGNARERVIENGVRDSACTVGDRAGAEGRELRSLSLLLGSESSVPSPMLRGLRGLIVSFGGREGVEADGCWRDVWAREQLARKAMLGSTREICWRAGRSRRWGAEYRLRTRYYLCCTGNMLRRW